MSNRRFTDKLTVNVWIFLGAGFLLGVVVTLLMIWVWGDNTSTDANILLAAIGVSVGFLGGALGLLGTTLALLAAAAVTRFEGIRLTVQNAVKAFGPEPAREREGRGRDEPRTKGRDTEWNTVQQSGSQQLDPPLPPPAPHRVSKYSAQETAVPQDPVAASNRQPPETAASVSPSRAYRHAPSKIPPPISSTENEWGTDPGLLIDVWNHFRDDEDGRFIPSVLRRHLERAGIVAEIMKGADLVASDSVLGVSWDGIGDIYLLPNFLHPPQAVAEWFDDQSSSGARSARVKRLVRPAVLRPTGGRFDLKSKGAVA